MYPAYFDCGSSTSISAWFSTSDCKPSLPHPSAAIFDDHPTTAGLSRTLSPTHPAPYFPTAASTFYPHSTHYVTRPCSDVGESPLVTSSSSLRRGIPARPCDVGEPPLVTSSRGIPPAQSGGVDSALMSAALLHSAAAAAAAEVNMMKNLPEHHVTNTGVMSDTDALRLRTKSHSSSGK